MYFIIMLMNRHHEIESAYFKFVASLFLQDFYSSNYRYFNLFILFDLILHVPSTIFQLNRDGSSWVEPVLS